MLSIRVRRLILERDARNYDDPKRKLVVDELSTIWNLTHMHFIRHGLDPWDHTINKMAERCEIMEAKLFGSSDSDAVGQSDGPKPVD